MSDSRDSRMRTGYTTGSCAAAAAKAAALALRGQEVTVVDIALPERGRAQLRVEAVQRGPSAARASVRKDAGDDPDVTHGALITCEVAPSDSGGIHFAAGPGVGTVTLPGLPVPPGEPAINPAPRRQIALALAEGGIQNATVTVSVQGGAALAERTFNPRLGILGGVSILGTSGEVRPFSHAAAVKSICAALAVARAASPERLVLVPGHHGRRAVAACLRAQPQEIVEVGDSWGAALDDVAKEPPKLLLVAGHPAKLVKLAFGQWNTHVSAGAAPVAEVRRWALDLGLEVPDVPTIDGIFTSLGEAGRGQLATAVALAVQDAVAPRLPATSIAVLLTNLDRGSWGHSGDLSPWGEP